MNTENVFFADLYSVEGVNDNTYFMRMLELNYVKHVLVERKSNIFGKQYMKDLNTNQKYKIKLSNKIGTLYISKSSLESFNSVTKNTKEELSKEKIKTLGNKYLYRKEEM